MRALRVLGATEDDHVICTDESGERFSLAIDADLRQAVRGSARPSAAAARQGQPRATADEGGESLLRPREIQVRIRAGESAEQVAQAAGTTVSRIERFAYPVLLERSTMADRGRKAVAVIGGTTSRRTLEELVASALGARGQGGALGWDAHRGPDGWVLSLRWSAGRSENRAEWAMHAGPGSGTVTALDDAATQLLDPTPQPLRTIDGPARGDLFTAPAAGSHHPALHGRTGTRPTPTPEAPAAQSAPAAAPVSEAAISRQVPPATAGSVIPADIAPPVEPERRNPAAGQQRSMLDSLTSPMARTGTDAGRQPRRGARAAMPSWDDVLLGGTQR
ncbi:DUF3071 domain-containing protein [Nakamurella flavida]|uniref:DUF3071 domain-containing protein n=1 Tax=Nakamurella flavida TaxID=363630 RepID=A0A938YGR9_9ACTN|nr:septation protein SepH [Nakamurella flavida]MBM9475627.1 DUF3071 domain-containing protein [Nakamurella flavida]MDP9778097.1 hypothetical protein [Nakamurella flavida]